ncbi:hypothetical protein BDN70DRAFT_978171 [Pholiota conissans]|uniref:Uncharacterized protein n=1 Tax=Pholiota conissans TaxID=109636 RepID=A0A9P5YL94_9AGAR|nr:hypothetical protein BDN70DRAFT_978171 [Pholiota conissans]
MFPHSPPLTGYGPHTHCALNSNFNYHLNILSLHSSPFHSHCPHHCCHCHIITLEQSQSSPDLGGYPCKIQAEKQDQEQEQEGDEQGDEEEDENENEEDENEEDENEEEYQEQYQEEYHGKSQGTKSTNTSPAMSVKNMYEILGIPQLRACIQPGSGSVTATPPI